MNPTAPYVHQAFPKFVFHGAQGSKIVNSPDELRELGAGWYETPDEAKASAPAPTAAPAVADNDGEGLSGEAKAIHASGVEALVAKIEKMTDPALLQRVLEGEARNPQHEGGRKGVTKAIEKRLLEIAKAAAAGDQQ